MRTASAERRVLTRTLLTWLLAASIAPAADWPMWRHDRQRTSATDEKLAPPLELAWTFRSRQAAQAPAPVHPHQVRYPQVTWYSLPISAAGDALFFTSAADGRIVCLDAATGETRWQFVAGAAVNRTPTFWNGKVYAGSDDGHVYCLNAKDGSVAWDFRAAPSDRLFVAYGRPVSVWPVRTDVVVDAAPSINDGKAVAYFAAGLFPYEGTFLYAVDAETGDVLWRNGTQCESGWRASMAPAGYLYVHDTYVLPARDTWAYGGSQWGMLTTFDRATGTAGGWIREIPPTAGAFKDGKHYGGAAVSNRWTDVDSAVGIRYKRPVFFRWDPDVNAIAYAGGIVYFTAFDLDASKGSGIYARSADDKTVLWSADVAGQASQIIVANGRLFASTRQGEIYCFAAKGGKAGGAREEAADPRPIAGAEEARAAAEAIVKASGVSAGYAVVLDSDSGALALELAQASKLHVTAAFADAAKAAAARAAYAKAGLHASRLAAVVRKEGERLPLPRYFADLIVSEAALSGGALPADREELNRVLKPYRGVALIGGKMDKAALEQWSAGMRQEGWSVLEQGGVWARRTAPALEDAGGWTHDFADAGNTSCSQDGALKPPLGVLWYGEPQLEDPGPGALIIDGVFLFCPGSDLVARDAYTGRELWRRPQSNTDTVCGPGSVFLRYLEVIVRLDPATGQELSAYKPPFPESQWKSVAASRDGKTLYLVAGGKDWGATLALDVASGNLIWQRGGPGKSEPWSGGWSVIGDGYIYCMGGAPDDAQREAAVKEMREYLQKNAPERLAGYEKDLAQRDIRMLATLDAKTGKVLHEHPVDITNCGGRFIPGTAYGTGKNFRHYNPPVSGWTMAHKDVVIFATASGADKGWSVWPGGAYRQRGIAVYSGATGKLLWNRACNYRTQPVVVDETVYAEPWGFDLHTGAHKKRVHPVTGEQADWAFCRWDKQCGRFCASKYFLFGRSLGMGFHDLLTDSGLYTFWHSRMNCFFDAFSGSGMMIKPANAIGCECTWSLPFTIAMGQVETPPPAPQGFAQPGPAVPVKHLYLDFGATGDRRDAKGNLWLNAPRGSGHPLLLGLDIKPALYTNAGPVQRSATFTPIENTDTPFVFATALRGLKSCTIPLTAPDGPSRDYTIRLGFAGLPGDKPGQRVFDVKIDGKTVLDDFDPLKEAGAPDRALWKEWKMKLGQSVLVELVTPTLSPDRDHMPLINGMVVLRQE